MTEYRLEQLALSAGTSVRNIRAYRDRGLLPPPRREGRVAYYSEAHLGRLRLIADLLDRGYTLQSIGELLAAWERGKDIGEVLGLEEVLSSPWSDEKPVTMTRRQLDELLGTTLSDAELDAMCDTGLLEPDDTVDTTDGQPTFVVRSVRQLEGGAALVAEGVPFDAVLEAARDLHWQIDRVAEQFVALVAGHVVDRLDDAATASDLTPLSGTIERLRPVAAVVVQAELGRAMERHVQLAVSDFLNRASVAVPNEAS